MDVGGFRLQDLEPEIVDGVDTYPRLDCGPAILELILAQVAASPCVYLMSVRDRQMPYPRICFVPIARSFGIIHWINTAHESVCPCLLMLYS